MREKDITQIEQTVSPDCEDNKYNIKLATALEVLEAVKNGDCIYKFVGSFKVILYRDFVYSVNLYTNYRYLKVRKEVYQEDTEAVVLTLLIPNALNLSLNKLSQRPKSERDINFWQYPCATEHQAFNNHIKLGFGSNVFVNKKEVNIYVPIPWATYIDKGMHCANFLRHLKMQMSYYAHIAKSFGWKLVTHSVCQHIHWKKIIGVAQEHGITCLHLSHKDSHSDSTANEMGSSLSLKPWPLIAVNYELEERKAGLEVLSVKKKKLLASFIGAHKEHYLDNSRVRLTELVKNHPEQDVKIMLNNEWFYNEVVYDEQVTNKNLSAELIKNKQTETISYNETLSDSIFSLCPKGAGPNTLRLWESIAVGSIPVLFCDDLALLHETKLGQTLKNLLVFQTIDNSLFDRLRKVKNKQSVSNALIEIYGRFSNMTCF